MRHFSRTELKAAINMLKEFTAKGNFAVLMYMGDTDKLEVSQTLNSVSYTHLTLPTKA